MGIKAAQRMGVLEMVLKLIYSQDEVSYQVHYQQLNNILLCNILVKIGMTLEDNGLKD